MGLQVIVVLVFFHRSSAAHSIRCRHDAADIPSPTPCGLHVSTATGISTSANYSSNIGFTDAIYATRLCHTADAWTTVQHTTSRGCPTGMLSLPEIRTSFY